MSKESKASPTKYITKILDETLISKNNSEHKKRLNKTQSRSFTNPPLPSPMISLPLHSSIHLSLFISFVPSPPPSPPTTTPLTFSPPPLLLFSSLQHDEPLLNNPLDVPLDALPKDQVLDQRIEARMQQI